MYLLASLAAHSQNPGADSLVLPTHKFLQKRDTQTALTHTLNPACFGIIYPVNVTTGDSQYGKLSETISSISMSVTLYHACSMFSSSLFLC